MQAEDITWESIRALRRIVALFLAIAGFAERAAARSPLMRWPVLLMLRPGEAVARDRVRRLMHDFGLPDGLDSPEPEPETDTSAADQAAHLARSFRALAAAVAALAEMLAAACAPEKPTAHARLGAAIRFGGRTACTPDFAVAWFDSS